MSLQQSVSEWSSSISLCDIKTKGLERKATWLLEDISPFTRDASSVQRTIDGESLIKALEAVVPFKGHWPIIDHLPNHMTLVRNNCQ